MSFVEKKNIQRCVLSIEQVFNEYLEYHYATPLRSICEYLDGTIFVGIRGGDFQDSRVAFF